MLPFLIFTLFILLVDLYVYKGLKVLLDKPSNPVVKIFFRTMFWLIPSILLASVVMALYFRQVDTDPRIFNSYFYIVAFTMLFYLPKLVFVLFHLLDDLVFVTERTVKSFTRFSFKNSIPFGEVIVNRRKFISRTGIILAMIPFLAVIYGVTYGRFDFQITEKSVEIRGLPASFDGFRILHISDIHAGSFYGYEERVKRAVDIINKQEADIIVFTGDLVNNFTSELDGLTDILSVMDARHGKYSILGNHDYGDYYQWESPEAKEQNMEDMFIAHEKIGFRLLLNQWDSLSVNGESIALIGVENWGEPPFPKYGDLEKASSGTENMPVRILLSHDPSHWDAEVIGATDIDLTLSGHTHGMQFGIEYRNFRWSPSQYKYPRWGGLYEEAGQYLYVNRGLGYLAFPGRIGMPPEITVIELRKPQELTTNNL